MRCINTATVIALLFASTICLLYSGCWNSDEHVPVADITVDDVEGDGVSDADEGEDSDSESRAVRLKIERLFSEIETGLNPVNLEKVVFPFAGLEMKKLSQSVIDERDIGFLDDEKDVQVTVSITPLPFSREVRSGFVKTFVESVVEVDYTRDVMIDGKQGVYIFGHHDEMLPSKQGVEQEDQEVTRRVQHIVGFGNDKYSWVVSGSFPKKNEDEVSKGVLASLLSSKLHGEIPQMKGDELDFSIVRPDSLDFSNGWGRRYVLTKEGKFPLETPEDCLVKFECPAIRIAVREENRLAFANRFLKVAPTIEVRAVSARNNVTVDGLEGFELIGVGSEAVSGAPLFVYTGILFDEDRFYVMTGWYGTVDESTDYLDDLKAMFRSFKRKK